MQTFLSRSVLTALCLAAVLTSGCLGKKTSGASSGDCPGIYSLGDSSFDFKLAMGANIIKPGRIPADQVPAQLPSVFLEDDGSYGGAPVFCTPGEARENIEILVKEGKLPSGPDWQVYLLEGDWKGNVYELKEGDYRLINPSRVVERVDTAK